MGKPGGPWGAPGAHAGGRFPWRGEKEAGCYLRRTLTARCRPPGQHLRCHLFGSSGNLLWPSTVNANATLQAAILEEVRKARDLPSGQTTFHGLR